VTRVPDQAKVDGGRNLAKTVDSALGGQGTLTPDASPASTGLPRQG
jgi:hypothetical protein